MRTKGLLVLAAMVMAVAPGCGKKSAKAIVMLEYRIKPVKPPPAGLKRLGIYPIKTGGNSPKWSKLASKRLESKLQEVCDANESDLEIVDQASFKAILEQKDLMLSDIVEGNDAIAAAKLKNVQAMISGTVDVKIDKQVTKKTKITGLSGFGGRHWGGGSVRTGEAKGIRRTIIIDVTFKLVDGANGKTLDSMTKVYKETDEKKPSLLFGSSKTEGDLEASDQIISDMVDLAVMDFLTRMFPYSYQTDVPIESGKTEASEMGVRAAAGEDYPGAARHLAAAVVEAPDAKTLFAYAVVLQAMGDYDKARRYYGQAVAEDDDNELYADCRNRLKGLEGRLAPPGG